MKATHVETSREKLPTSQPWVRMWKINLYTNKLYVYKKYLQQFRTKIIGKRYVNGEFTSNYVQYLSD